ncbi:MAG: cobalamin-dependent protein [Actinomycetia bacterium]|nr:cobalamin-dependent protein [Actinomycetes bacterium]
MKTLAKRLNKVMLITPPYHCGVLESAGNWLPLGFVYIAGSLREAGFDVKIYDAMTKNHYLRDIQRHIESYQPDVVATTAYTSTYPAASEVIKMAKRVNPSVVTIMGGVHPTFMWEESLTELKDVLDFIVRGEGEATTTELLSVLRDKNRPENVSGIAYLSNGHPVSTSSRPFIENLDSLWPAWDLVNWEDYIYFASDNKRLAVVSTSRGCLEGCTFCSQQLLWRKTWRARKPSEVIKELQILKDKFGVEVVMFADEYPTYDRNRWEEMLDLLIKHNIGIEILMETRVEDIVRDEDIIGKYKNAGVSHIYVGAEAVTQERLDFFKKNAKVRDSKRAIDLINSTDIVTETSFVLGIPDESDDSIQKTIELAKYYNADMTFFLAIGPWPYSEIYPELKPYIATKDYSKYNFMIPVVKPKKMSLGEVQEALDRAHKEFYMHKMQQVPLMSSFKREYMKDVFRILKNSCIGDLMKEITIPEYMKTTIR